MTICGLETHPAADLLPLMEGEELNALVADIKVHGLIDPIVTLREGERRTILDGRNRLRACELAGVQPRFEEWRGSGSPIEWVISHNLKRHRRHLNTSQRALIAAGMIPLLEKEQRERQKAMEQTATSMSIALGTVVAAQALLKSGANALITAVRNGEVPVWTAVRSLPKKRGRPPRNKEHEWPIVIQLEMPHSALPAIARKLVAIGFKGALQRRRFKLRRDAQLY